MDAHGNRFHNESAPYDFVQSAISRKPAGEHFWHQVWDGNWKNDVPRFHTVGCSTIYMQPEGGSDHDAFPGQLDEWIEPEMEQFVADGRIVKADTLDALADALGFTGEDKENFLATCERQNENFDAQSDPDFGKEPFRLSELRTPPFYASVKSCGFTLCTTDGVVVNDDLQPLTEDGAVIEGVYAVGNDGAISVEESQTIFGIDMDIVEGMQYERGYISPYMATDMEKMEAVLKDPFILLTDMKINSIQDMVPLLEEVMRAQRPLFIVAEDVEGEALSTILLNRLRGTLNVVAIKAPGFGDRRKRILEDIAVVTGAQVIDKDFGMTMADARIDMLGHAKTVKVTKDSALIVDGAGDKKAIDDRIGQIKAELERVDSDFDREKLQERLAKLAGGVAVIRVGAATEVEMKEKKLRIEDALSATKAAVEEGIVAGGGTILVDVIPDVMKATEALEGDEKTGAKIVINALREPLRQIVKNAGLEGSVVVDKIENSGKVGYGFNAQTEAYGMMLEDFGVVDPTKVTRSALQNASSVAEMVLTTESLVADIPEKEPPMPAGGDPSMGGMY